MNLQGEMQDDPIEAPLVATPPPGRTSRVLVALLLLVALVAALLVVAWQFPATRAPIARVVGLQPSPASQPEHVVTATSPPFPLSSSGAAPAASATIASSEVAASASASAIDARLSELEKRLTRIDMQSQAASGNAARAEGLLIAYATRRTIDRGAPLGYLEDQLRLRFADAQPNAVDALITNARNPVTLDTLYAQLTALTPKLTGVPPQDSTWGQVKREIAGLFVIRHQTGTGMRPEDRIAQAKLMLAEGKTGEAAAEVERLPGAAEAAPWIASLRRYDTIQRALDLIETTAMLDPHRLKDGNGVAVDQPSPVAAPGN